MTLFGLCSFIKMFSMMSWMFLQSAVRTSRLFPAHTRDHGLDGWFSSLSHSRQYVLVLHYYIYSIYFNFMEMWTEAATSPLLLPSAVYSLDATENREWNGTDWELDAEKQLEVLQEVLDALSAQHPGSMRLTGVMAFEIYNLRRRHSPVCGWKLLYRLEYKKTTAIWTRQFLEDRESEEWRRYAVVCKCNLIFRTCSP